MYKHVRVINNNICILLELRIKLWMKHNKYTEKTISKISIFWIYGLLYPIK